MEVFQPLAPRQLVPLVDIDTDVSSGDCCALFSDACAETVNVEIDIDAIGNRLPMAVLHDKVLNSLVR